MGGIDAAQNVMLDAWYSLSSRNLCVSQKHLSVHDIVGSDIVRHGSYDSIYLTPEQLDT